ncbi:MAG: hypothetical protein KDB71_00360 [Mycobacterium sp.]|nr:hypothetical protein [Mycobacterium sp.]
MASPSADRATPRSSGIWIVELNVAGCTVRRRTAKRRYLLRAPLPVPRQLAARLTGTT